MLTAAENCYTEARIWDPGRLLCGWQDPVGRAPRGAYSTGGWNRIGADRSPALPMPGFPVRHPPLVSSLPVAMWAVQDVFAQNSENTQLTPCQAIAMFVTQLWARSGEFAAS